MRAFPMDAQAYVGVGAPIRADYYVVSPHIIRVAPEGHASNLRGPSAPLLLGGYLVKITPQTPLKAFPSGK